MRKFYEQVIALSLLALALLTALIFGGHKLSGFKESLLPKAQAVVPWQLLAVSGSDGKLNNSGEAAGAFVQMHETDRLLDFDFGLSSDASYPYISVEMRFNKLDSLAESDAVIDHIDLSRYNGLRFVARCEKPEVMTVVVQMYDAQLAAKPGWDDDRIASHYFNCPTEPTLVEVKFSQFEVPAWWQLANEIDLTDTQLHIDKVRAFAWGASLQTARDTSNHVTISEVALVGYRWSVVLFCAVVALLGAIAFIIYLFKLHSIALRAYLSAKQERDKPLVAYQKVVLEPHRDKERSMIIGYIAEHYTDSELTLEIMTQQVGISRTKVNDIIKDEIGLTFTAYINKLRLTEASRLLKENSEASVSEVVFAVGYNNASYFNKLFKAEFGCTPKTYRQHN